MKALILVITFALLVVLSSCSEGTKGPSRAPAEPPKPTYHTVTSCIHYEDQKRQVCSNNALGGAAIGWLIGMPLTGAVVGSGKSECHEEVIHNCVESKTEQVLDQ